MGSPSSATPAPEVRSWAGARRWLLAGLLLQTAAHVGYGWRHYTSLNSLLFVDLGLEESLARAVELVLLGVLGAAALSLLLRPRAWACWVLAAGFLVEASSKTLIGGSAYAELSLASQAVRWLSPLALGALLGSRAGLARPLLRLGISATFFAHGWKAFQGNPAFLDLILGSAQRWTSASPSEAAAADLLRLIGLMDMALAVGLWGASWRGLAAWAGLWGLITACSRTTALGPSFADQTLLRALNAFAPWALWCLWQNAPRERLRP